MSKEDWGDVAYYTLLMIDNVIDLMNYPFPSLEHSAKSRRSTGIGITDLAGHMAELKLRYSSEEGKKYLQTLAELHMYSCIKASLRLAKEKGTCDWIDKTKWVDGWMPIDTMNKNIIKKVGQPLLQDWETLRKDVVENGGIRNSVLVAYMPNESSSVATNGTNSILPARNVKVLKTNGSKITRFLAPNADTHEDFYELAYDIPTKDMIDVYAIFQCFTDQAISADEYRDFTKGKVTSKQLLSDFLYMVAVGMKTRYYVNSKTVSASTLSEENNVEPETVVEDDTRGCSSGGCSL